MPTLILSKENTGKSEPEFVQFFQEHSRFIYRTAYGVLRSRSDAEDVLQQVFLKLLERELPLDLTQNPRAYLYRAAVNRSLNIVRSRKNEVLTDDFRSIDRPVEMEPNDSDERYKNLMEAIALLSRQSAEVLILRYTHSFSDVDIAKLLGRSRGSVAVMLYRAKAKLRRLIIKKTGKR